MEYISSYASKSDKTQRFMKEQIIYFSTKCISRNTIGNNIIIQKSRWLVFDSSQGYFLTIDPLKWRHPIS